MHVIDEIFLGNEERRIDFWMTMNLNKPEVGSEERKICNYLDGYYRIKTIP